MSVFVCMSSVVGRGIPSHQQQKPRSFLLTNTNLFCTFINRLCSFQRSERKGEGQYTKWTSEWCFTDAEHKLFSKKRMKSRELINSRLI